MDAFFDVLTGLVASDRPGRAVSRLCGRACWSGALAMMNSSRRVAVVTGFFVPGAGAAETDGPGGAVVLGRALSRSGRECRVFTDPLCFPVVSAASKSIEGVPVQAAEGAGDILSWGPDLVIFVERLGRAADGCFYNMRGEDISSFTHPLDLVALRAKEAGIAVMAVGDGGNEVGMGTLKDELSVLLPGFERCLCDVAADVLIPVDVSNWGAYALAVLLSAGEGRWLGHTPGEESVLLQAVIRAGAVDGVTLRGECSVDGFSLEEQQRLVVKLGQAWKDCGDIQK